MSLTKTEFVLKSFSKISKKKWEFFIISRILHHINDDDIEFVTQQLVRRPDGSRALTDLFFPQFNIHLEIDEPHHQNQENDDFKREQDIIQVTGHRVERIGIADDNEKEKTLNTIRNEVDNFAKLILQLKHEAIRNGTFSPWDFEERYSSESVIARGFVSVEDNVVFRTQIEAMRCFGFKGKGWQRGAWKIKDGTDDIVWFPRLYEHGMWHNELIDEGARICERALVENDVVNAEAVASIKKQIEDLKKHPKRKHIELESSVVHDRHRKTTS